MIRRSPARAAWPNGRVPASARRRDAGKRCVLPFAMKLAHMPMFDASEHAGQHERHLLQVQGYGRQKLDRSCYVRHSASGTKRLQKHVTAVCR